MFAEASFTITVSRSLLRRGVLFLLQTVRPIIFLLMNNKIGKQNLDLHWKEET